MNIGAEDAGFLLVLLLLFLWWLQPFSLLRRREHRSIALSVLLLAGLGGLIWIWPHLPIGTGPAAQSRQSSVALTFAQVLGTVVVLLFTAGLVIAELVSRYTVRAFGAAFGIGLSLYATALITLGIIFPFWVALEPTQLGIELAFFFSAGSLVSLFAFFQLIANRLQPERIVHRAFVTIQRATRKGEWTANASKRERVHDSVSQLHDVLAASATAQDRTTYDLCCNALVRSAILISTSSTATSYACNIADRLVTEAVAALRDPFVTSYTVRNLSRITDEAEASSQALRTATAEGLTRLGIAAANEKQVSVASEILSILTKSALGQLRPIRDNGWKPRTLSPLPMPQQSDLEASSRRLIDEVIKNVVSLLVSLLETKETPSFTLAVDDFTELARTIVDKDFMGSSSLEKRLEGIAQQAIDNGQLASLEVVLRTLRGVIEESWSQGYDSRTYEGLDCLSRLMASAANRNDFSAMESLLRSCDEVFRGFVTLLTRATDASQAYEVRLGHLLVHSVRTFSPVLGLVSDNQSFHASRPFFDLLLKDIVDWALQTNSKAANLAVYSAAREVGLIYPGWQKQQALKPGKEAAQEYVWEMLAIAYYPQRTASFEIACQATRWAIELLRAEAGEVPMIAHNPDRSPPADRGDGDDHWRVADWKNAYATWQYAPRCRWWRGRKREDFAPALRLEPGDDIGSLAFIHLRETEGPGRVYSGHRPLGRAIVTVQEADGSRRLLTHGAHGGSALEVFEWGYGGHGPSNLSESIIDDAVDSVASCPSCLGALYGSDWGPDHCRFCHGSGKHPSLHQLYDAFKWNFIASWQDDDWQLSQRDILQWLISTPRRILIS